ncbi:MAG TPA: response regulator transcription factor [Dokdonella sp.]|uniref:response regulator transcription factor n=1 Tax=Dokdonella sp. TaxID=2291710 RepID=UPI002D7EEAC2|nr:response regulator transcription factor [Dokdonella sp.]HET9033861.1 response regulator transcription factor [Dokdonella sp.]
MTDPILLVDDEPSMLERLQRILTTLGHDENSLRLAATLAEGKVQGRDTSQLGMALVDLGLPDGSGIELVAWLRERNDALPILVISAWSTEEMILGALRAGASGYVLKERDDLEIAMSLRSVLAGGAPIDPFIARRILALVNDPATAQPASAPSVKLQEPLTRREMQILQCVADGMSNREIADDLSITRATVETHVQKVYRKLSVNSRTQALLAARQHGLLP